MSGSDAKLLENRFRALDACPPEVVIEGMTLAIESAAEFGVEIKKVEANLGVFEDLYFAVPDTIFGKPTWKKMTGKYVLGFSPDVFPSEPFLPAATSFYSRRKQFALRNPEKLSPSKEHGFVHLKSPVWLGKVRAGTSSLVQGFLNARGVECYVPGSEWGLAGVQVNENDVKKAKQLIVQFFGKDPSWASWSTAKKD